MTQRKPTPSYTAEFRTRGVRLFKENRADYASEFKLVRACGSNDPGGHLKARKAAYQAIAPKLGCSPDSLRVWYQRAARDAGDRSGATSEAKARLKVLERENRELRQANEILKKGETIFRH